VALLDRIKSISNITISTLRTQNTTDAGASLPPLQPVEGPADRALEGYGKDHRIGKQADAGICKSLSFFNGGM